MRKKSFILGLKKVRIADLNFINGGNNDETALPSDRGDSCTNTRFADTTCDTCGTKCCPTTISTSEPNSISDTVSLLDC